MWDFEFTYTDSGVMGVMPCGDQIEFPTEEEYREAYKEEEDEIYDEMARLHYYDEPIDYPEYV